MPDYIFVDRGAEFPPSQNLLGNIDVTFGAITRGCRLALQRFVAAGPATSCGNALPVPTFWFREWECSLRSRDYRSDLCSFPVGLVDGLHRGLLLFFNTGRPILRLANVTPPAVRASAIRVKHLHHSPPGRCHLSAVNWYGARSLEHERRALGSRGPDGYGR